MSAHEHEDVICQFRYAEPLSKLIATLLGSFGSAAILVYFVVFGQGPVRIAGQGQNAIEVPESAAKVAGGVLAFFAVGSGCVAGWKICERFAQDTRIAVTETHFILPGIEADFEGRVLERRIPFNTIGGLSVRPDKQTRENIAFTFEAEGNTVTVLRDNLPTHEAFDEVLHLVQRRVTWGDRELPDYVAQEEQHRKESQKPAWQVMGVPQDSVDLRLVKLKEFPDLAAAREFAGFLREGGAFKQIEVRERPAASPTEHEDQWKFG